MSSSHRVSVEIGASLSTGWTSAFRRAPAQVSQLGDAIRTLEVTTLPLIYFASQRHLNGNQRVDTFATHCLQIT